MSPLREMRAATPEEIENTRWGDAHHSRNEKKARVNPLFDQVLGIVNESQVAVLTFEGEGIWVEAMEMIEEMKKWCRLNGNTLSFRIRNEYLGQSDLLAIFVRRRPST